MAGMADLDWSGAVAALDSAGSVVLACHVDPDGDALGSMLALAAVLSARGVDVAFGWDRSGAVEADEVPHAPGPYGFLPGIDGALAPADLPTGVDVGVAIDTGSAARLGRVADALAAARTMVVIDHHRSGTPFGDVRVIDPNAPATAVLVAELLEHWGVALDVDIATCLWTALVTDTGRFSFEGTTADTLALAARLVATGIDHVGITRRILDTRSLGAVQLLGGAMAATRHDPGTGLVWAVVTLDDRAGIGVDLAQTEGLVDMLRSVESAAVAMVVKQLDDGTWKASLRSRGHVDVGAIAAAVGGGGHRAAAGFSTDAGPDDVVEVVLGHLRGERGDR